MDKKAEKLIGRGSEILEEIKKMKNPLIVHHYDCDGISSGSIVVKGLMDNDINFTKKSLKNLDEENIKKLKNYQNIIFVDLGNTPYIDELKENIIIIDHHPLKTKTHLQINPLQFGFDGGMELSASGTAYFVFNHMEDIAIVGAVGDMQTPLTSLNRYILEKGIKKGVLKRENDILLYGKSSRSLPHMLSYSDDPFIPGISGNEEEAVRFLIDKNIPLKKGSRWNTYYDLGEKSKEVLRGSLIEYMSMWGVSKQTLFGEVYLLPKWPKKTPYYVAQEFATILNACGRNGKEDIGVDVCLKKSNAFKSAEELLLLHKKNLKEGLNYAKQNLVEFSNFYFLDGRNMISDTIIGVVIGMLFSMKRNKPYVGVSDYSESEFKISARAIEKNDVDLGGVISNIIKKIGGVGGGHKLAAGAVIQKDKLDDFLLLFNDELI
ncbi:DHH family phosphoesterase [Candidatus Micrarchaeota archaeon]|nr:DHH family phosphoesterase [Candidatus Micrarchaeota archaeon]